MVVVDANLYDDEDDEYLCVTGPEYLAEQEDTAVGVVSLHYLKTDPTLRFHARSTEKSGLARKERGGPPQGAHGCFSPCVRWRQSRFS